MWLILTHENADFDAVASQWAAHRLFPDGVPLLSRRVNRNVSRFLTQFGGAFAFRTAESWRRRNVAQVLLVDTHAVPSVRGIRPKTPVKVIDHHTITDPAPQWDIHCEPVGAATTLLTEMLRARAVSISAAEATLFLLGIYEDTGRLTYDTTTPRDARAAAWLLAQGADLPQVRTFLDSPLSEAQLALYRQLVDSAEWLSIEGQQILVAVTQGPDDFEDEISGIVNRLRDDFAPHALLVLVGLPQRAHFVARSTVPAVDVAVVATALGGGGHGRAAAATIRFKSLDTVKEMMLAALVSAVQPIMRVGDIMSHHVKTVRTTDTIAAAALEMQRYGHEGYPVIDDDGRVAGLLTRHTVDRALNHQLSDLPVSQVMIDGSVTVTPADSVTTLQNVMQRTQWGQVPVVDAQTQTQILGIVTRTDVLRVNMPAEPQPDIDLRERLRHALPPAVWQIVQVISREAAAMGVPVYFVGGLVRDVLLGQPPSDIDFVVEGDAIALVTRLTTRYGGDVYTHQQFGTAKWLLDGAAWRVLSAELETLDDEAFSAESIPQTLDFVTARTEYYQAPTALPTVSRGAIKLDLLRRDFTINTLAVRLDGAHLGQLLDYYGGVSDLNDQLIRILHSLSFTDDPTRILRAIRFEQRLGFTIEPRTLELLHASLDLLKRVTGPRIRRELELALLEADPVRVMARLDEIGVLARLVPTLQWTDRAVAYFAKLPVLLANPLWQHAKLDDTLAPLYFFLWMAPLPAKEQRALMDRLHVRNTTRHDALAVNALSAQLPTLESDAPPSVVEKMLRPYADHPRVLLTVRILLDNTPYADLLDRYQATWRHVKPFLDGHDLLASGLKPGPHFADILDHLLAGRLDGRLSTIEDERAAVAHYAAQLAQP